MDIIENGVNAGADLIHLSIMEDRKGNRLQINITDNGPGIPTDMLERVTDPFFTTRKTRRVGLGLSLFREASRRCDGEFKITSEEGKGTAVEATFRLDHIDLAPMGDLASTMTTLIMGNPDVDFVYTHDIQGRTYHLDTQAIKKELDGIPIQDPKVLKYIGDSILNSLKDLEGESSDG
jgi:hypothetical protein